MFMTKRELDRRIAEGVATARANEASRSILPYWDAVNDSGLAPQAEQRAAALRAAKDILGDVLTEDLLDAADFIHDGTRYGVDDDDDADAPVHDEASGYFLARLRAEQYPDPKGDALRQHMDDMLARVREQVADLASASDTPAHYISEESRKDRAKPYFDHDEQEMVTRADADKRIRETPDTAPLVKLSPEAAERLEKLREASRVSWGTTFGSAEPVTVPGRAGDSVTIERLDDDEPDERGSTDGQTHG
jgi:hypothetical protein